MKSPATSKARIDAAIQLCIMLTSSLRELFTRDQIDWFDDNIAVAYCTHTQGAAMARWNGAGARQQSRVAAASVAIDFVQVGLLLTPFRDVI